MKKSRISFISVALLILLSFISLPNAKKDEIFDLLMNVSPTGSVISDHDAISDKEIIVKRVVDGDTIVVLENGREEKVRLVGINSPETVDPRKPVECFGKEASQHLKAMLTGKEVVMQPDASQAERDRYDRLIRYVFLTDGTFINEQMIREGFAYEYTYDVPYAYQDRFKKAEEDAKAQGKGLWGNICSAKG